MPQFRHLFLVLILGFFLLPHHTLAATADLRIEKDHISFSEEVLVAGDRVRIYAQVENVGDVDVSGYVAFFQGSIPIDDSQTISVRANGVPEEVFVDYIVPSGSFNIRAEIRETDPVDEYSDNNVAITGLFHPIQDTDRDGVQDEEDNCPDVANDDQTDTDGDGTGDACDPDDDNDGVDDEEERSQGSDPAVVDTDGDGVDDSQDAYPTDPERTEETPESDAVEQAVVVAQEESDNADSEEVVDEAPEDAESAEPETQDVETEADGAQQSPDVTDDEPEIAPASTGTSPNAVFRVRRNDWNTFTFEALAPARPEYRFEWDFGDGVTSNRREIAHTFNGYGAFDVSLRVRHDAGIVSQDKTTVHVPFFTLENRIVMAVLGLLGLLFVVGVAVTWRLRQLDKEAARNEMIE